MNRIFLTLLTLLLSVTLNFAQSIWLEEAFDKPETRWFPLSGSTEWSLAGSDLRCVTKGYDQLLSSKLYALGTTPYSFEVSMRGARAGIYFHLDNTAAKPFSHMVRFDDQSILTGYFNGAGEFHATNTFESPFAPTEWLTLRVNVDPLRGRYEVLVNGRLLGIDSMMMFRSGYLGLQASDGISEFKSVKVFGPSDQKPLPAAKIGQEVNFQHVQYVKSDGSDVVIYNPEAGLLQTLDRVGKLKEENPITRVPALSRRAMMGNYLFEIEGTRILVRDSQGAIVDSLFDRLSAPSSLIAGQLDNKPVLYVADPGINAVLMFDEKLHLMKSFHASSIGGFRGPLSVDRYGRDELVIADFDRLVFVGIDLEEIEPNVRFVSPTEAEVTWKRTSNAAPRVDFFQKVDVSVSASADGKSNIAHLAGLQPLTRYSYYLSPTLRTIPSSASYSRLFRMATPPADPTMTAYARLPLMYMVYRIISYRDKYPKDRFPNIPDGRTLTDDEILYLKQATDFNSEFFFRNSGCRIMLDFDFAVVEDTLWLHDVGDQDPYWLSPNERVAKDFERQAARLGKKPEEYAGLLCPYAWVNYPPRRTGTQRNPPSTDSIKIRQAYGGGTYGVPAPWRYGKTAGYTGNPFQDIFSRQDWLITHEFHHQLDALMEASGFTEYYHSDLPWKMPGRFGEDFDFNAQIIRLAPRDAWVGLAFGSLGQTKDADHDGVPDDDPSLPFDERKLGGNPGKKDTDGDGLADLDEVMAGTSLGANLGNRDTDDDDLPDGSDPKPLYEFNGAVKRGTASTYIGSIQQKDLVADIYAGWDDRYFYVRYEADRPAHILVQVDGNADGWFHGFDNIQSRILAFEDSLSVANFYLRDCSNWVQSPRDRRDILKTTDLVVDVQKQRIEVTGRPVRVRGRGILSQSRTRVDTYVLTAKIPRLPAYGFDLQAGKKIGLRIGLQTTLDLWVWHELFERNYMMEVELR